jgi:hypothetical protein
MSSNPFDWLNTINDSKTNLIKEDPDSEKGYLPFMVNRGLSYFPDTVMYANEMNRFAFLDKKLQYEFLLSSVSKRKRFSKWAKKESSAEVALVKKHYNVSEQKALEILKLLTPDQLKCIEKMHDKGGR